MPAIIVEGPDLCGKTTLLKRIMGELVENRQEFHFKHYGLLPESWDYRLNYLETVNLARSGLLLLDRFTDSELVYGPVYRGGVNSKFTAANQEGVYGALAAVGTTVVYCRSSDEVILERFKRFGDNVWKDPSKMLEIAHCYDGLYQYGQSPKHPKPGIDLVVADTNEPLSIDFVRGLLIKIGVNVKDNSRG